MDIPSLKPRLGQPVWPYQVLNAKFQELKNKIRVRSKASSGKPNPEKFTRLTIWPVQISFDFLGKLTTYLEYLNREGCLCQNLLTRRKSAYYMVGNVMI